MSNQFKRGDYVRKKGGKGQWHGFICGEYDTINGLGYAVKSVLEENSVQIYPASALEPWDGKITLAGVDLDFKPTEGE